MKKIVLSFISVAIMSGSFSQNIFTYGTKAVTKDEFLRAFNKNPNVTSDRKQALKEYLDLYTNFKLKVQAAYDEGLDKDATQLYELQNFRRQIADNIINDEANVKELVKQAFERSQKEIHLTQVYIEVPVNTDTIEAYRQIQAAYKQLQDGKDFSETVRQVSNDEGTRNANGDLGYITVFTLPYNLENIAYSLKPNSFSMPAKTKMGYHIFKNAGERKPAGSRRVSQILVSIPPGATAEDENRTHAKADSIYNLLQKGENFESLVVTASNDLSSSNNRGELPEFTTGTYSEDFEKAAFSLQQPGDFSKPIKTSFGYHILKLLEAKPVGNDLSDAATSAALQEKVRKDNRMDLSKNELIEKKLALIKYKPANVNQNDLFIYTDSATVRQPAAAIKGITGNTLLFSFARQNIKASDWVQYIKSVRGNMAPTAKNEFGDLYKQYVRSAADEFYRNNMELYNPDFARQVQEFKEANLLFAIMEKNVWGKANTDSAGLAQYYNQHKEKYTWGVSADALIVTCSNKAITDSIQGKLTTHISDWRQITGSSGGDVSADSGRFELGQLPVVERTNFTNGLITAPVKNDNDGTYTFNYIFKVYHEPGQRSFDDARGMVISDYQQVLEDKWIALLKKKYPVKVNEVAFASLR